MPGEGNLRRERGPEVVGGPDPPAFPRGPTCWRRGRGPCPRSSIMDATLASWPVGPSSASTTRSATSQSSIRLRAWTTDSTSGALLGLAPPPDSRRVHEPEAAAARLEQDVHGVARRAGDLRDDRALLAEERVESEDFPTFGRPTTARAISSRPSSERSSPPFAGQPAGRSRPAGRRRRCRARPRRRRPRGTRAPRPPTPPRGPRAGRSCWRRRRSRGPPRGSRGRPRGHRAGRPPTRR